MNIFDYIIGFLFYHPCSSVDQQDHHFFFFFRLFFFCYLNTKDIVHDNLFSMFYLLGRMNRYLLVHSSLKLFVHIIAGADLAFTDIEHLVVLVIGLLLCSSFWCFFSIHTLNDLILPSLSLAFFHCVYTLPLWIGLWNITVCKKYDFPCEHLFSLSPFRFAFCSRRLGIVR